MNRLLRFFSFAILSGLLFGGCYPGGADYTSDYDVVYTNYNDTFDFKVFNTYAMPDQIVIDVEITNGGDTIYEYMKPKYADPILDQIANNMANYGWTRVDIADNPDMLLMPAGISSTTYFYSYWYGWWYGGYYPPGWGWYYPPYYTVSSYTTGSMIMTLTDPNSDSPINRAPLEWIGVVNGVLTNSANINRALSGIDQAFEQSPYLKIN